MQLAREFSPEIPLRALNRKREKQVKGFKFNIFAFVLLFVVGLAFVYVYQQALVAQNAIETSELKKILRQEKVQVEKAKVKSMVLKSPARLEKIATEKLGMIKPKEVKYIVYSAEKRKNKVVFSQRKRSFANLFTF